MDDYISRDAAIEALFMAHSPYPRRREISVEAIKKVPAANVRPVVRGEWIVKGHGGQDPYTVCSKCGYDIDYAMFKLVTFHNKTGSCSWNVPRTNFCPNCGADMREVKQIDMDDHAE